jgi:plasmid stability protein
MAQLVITDVDEAVMSRLRWKAEQNGRTIEDEVREVLVAATRRSREEFLTRAAELRAKMGPQQGPDSVELIREDRER